MRGNYGNGLANFIGGVLGVVSLVTLVPFTLAFLSCVIWLAFYVPMLGIALFWGAFFWVVQIRKNRATRTVLDADGIDIRAPSALD